MQYSTMPLKPIIANYPFNKWGLDFIVQINPPSSIGHIFILISIDYFTKWFEVVPLKNATADNVINFFKENLLLIFGVLVHIVTNNGIYFVSHKFTLFYSKFNIKHSFSSSYYP